MSAHANPDIVTNGLVFGFDTGYPLVSESHETYRYNRGEPTTTFDIGTMVPTNPNTAFTSNATYHNNLHGTVWDWSYYPNSNISSDGGMEWVPNYRGPGFTGAWKMKKRAGGNSESNFSGTDPGSIDSSKTYTVSVWCKTDQASMARIHVNTTRSGSSYWGYGSSYHSGGGDWERLSVTIYGGEGNTSINTIRCQCYGTTINADAYWRDYQVEERSHATPFILGGTRSATGSLIDLTGTTNIDVSNASFDSNAQMTFDGTDDYLSLGSNSTLQAIGSNATIECWFKSSNTSSKFALMVGWGEGTSYYSNFGIGNWFSAWPDESIYVGVNSAAVVYAERDGSAKYHDGNWHHAVGLIGQNNHKIFVDGSEVSVSFSYGSNSVSTSNIFGFSSGTEVYIGLRPYGNGHFQGDLPVVKIYDRLLTAAEVLQNFNATKSRFGL